MTPAPDPRELLQLISEGFLLVDADFMVIGWNAEAQRIDGRSANDIIGRSVWDCWPDLTTSKLGRLWQQAMSDRRPVSLEHFYTWPTGRHAWIEMRAFPADHGLAIFFRDVSDRKQAQEELQATQSELIHASRLSAMGEMAATLAHELSQPLTAVSNYIEATARLIRDLPDGQVARAREALDAAEAAAERSREILHRVRTFVAKRPIRFAVHDIHTIISDALTLVRPHALREGVAIETPDGSGPLWVEADSVQIQQVLINLVRNSIEALAGTRTPRVILIVRSNRESVMVNVEDNGPGFAQSAEPMFMPFESNKPDGLGLGLSISRTIIEAHGGRIEAQKSQTGGAAISFSLRRAERT